MSLRYRADIDGLRAIAVVPVLVFHAGLGLPGGYVGVDVFFVISGYLITHLIVNDLETDKFSLFGFYARRARRILPALLAMMLVVTIVASVLFLPDDLVWFGYSLAATAAFLANVWFHNRHGYFVEAAELQPLLHSWSLGVEEQFYLVFPVLILVIWRLGRGRAVMPVLAVLAAISLVASEWATTRAPDAAFYLPQYRVWELLVGSLLAIASTRGWLEARGDRRWIAEISALVGLLAIVSAVLIFDQDTPFPGMAALLPCLGTALVIGAGSIAPTAVTRALSLPGFVHIGRISYSLYLWHWPVISFTYYVSGDLSTAEGVICVAVSFALAGLSWALVEQPFRDGRRFDPLAVLAMATYSAMVVGTVGVVLVAAGGFPGRIPAHITALADRDNWVHDRRDCHGVLPVHGRAGDVCIRGAEDAAPRFALVGDSHADALSPAIFEAARELGLAGYQYTSAGFRPLAGIAKRGDPDWEEQTEAFIEFLTARPEIRTIFVTAYWSHLMTGRSYRDYGAVWVDDGYDGSGSRYNKVAALAGLRRLSARLPEVTIVLLDDVPTGPALHLSTHARALRFGMTPTVGLQRAEADRQRASYEAHFRELARNTPRIRYEPMMAELCGPDLCPLFDGDEPIFRDGDHLSAHGAAMLVDEAAALLRQYFPE